MKQEHKNLGITVVGIAGLTALIAVLTTCTLYVCKQSDDSAESQQMVVEADSTTESKDVTASWETYTSEAQGFSFKVPHSYIATESDHYENPNMRTISIIQVDKFGNMAPPPAMQIHVWADAGIVEATLWEGGAFRWYEEILHSFSFNNGKTSF